MSDSQNDRRNCFLKMPIGTIIKSPIGELYRVMYYNRQSVVLGRVHSLKYLSEQKYFECHRQSFAFLKKCEIVEVAV